MNVLPLPVIGIAGGVLLFLFTDGEIRAARNQNRGNAGVDLKALVHICRKFPGVGIKQTVDFLMVHRVYPCFLPLGKLYGFLYIAAVFCRCATGLVVGIAVHFLCAAGGSFVDRIVFHGGRLRFLWGAFRRRRLFRLLLCGLWLQRDRLRFLLLYGGFLLLDFSKMPVNGFNQLCGGAADCFKRAFQLRKLLAAAPPGDISERIVGRVKPVVLADGVSDAFRLYLAGTAVGARRVVRGGVVHSRMGYFVNCRFNVL